MIDKALYNYIKANVTYEGVLVYGFADALINPPYIIMRKITPAMERPVTFCQKQGDAGIAFFQFSAYCGGTGEAATPAYTMEYLEAFKEQVAQITGEINGYRVWENQTDGITVLSENETSTKIWGAVFDIKIRWEVL